MFAGHFGLAAAVKSRTPKVPLWALMLSTQLLDVFFVPFLLTGTETMEPVEGAGAYGDSVIHADYTHSLAGALLIALAAGWLASRKWGRKGGWTIGAVVMSHWVLDLIVHRADLPILPGNAGGLPLLGFGLWRWPAASMAAELLLIAVGAAMYYRSLLKPPGKPARRLGPNGWAGLAMAALLVASLATDALGIG
jgi:hypothetical protein